MKENVSAGISAGLLAIFVFITIFAFSLTGVNTEKLLSPNIINLIEYILTINFLIFVIMAGITIATILFICENNQIKKGILLSIAGTFIGGIIGILLIREYLFIIPLLLSCLGIPLASKVLETKEKEYKYLPFFRASSSAANKVIVLFCLGVLLLSLFLTMPNMKQIEQDFPKEIILTVFGEEQKPIEPIINTIVSSQTQLIDAIQSNQSYMNLVQKSDPDAISLNAYLTQVKVALNSETNHDKASDLALTMFSQNQFVKFFAGFAWLIYSLFAFIFTMLIGSIVIQNLAAGFYYIATKIQGVALKHKEA